jgi:hypothetical protein
MRQELLKGALVHLLISQKKRALVHQPTHQVHQSMRQVLVNKEISHQHIRILLLNPHKEAQDPHKEAQDPHKEAQDPLLALAQLPKQQDQTLLNFKSVVKETLEKDEKIRCLIMR